MLHLSVELSNSRKLLSIIFLVLIISLLSCNNEGNNNVGKVENYEKAQMVSVCRYCQLVVEWSEGVLFPDNKKIQNDCSYWEGHKWYNAGTSGYNKFKCETCQVEVSISESKPRCLTFCETACGGNAPHQWVSIN